MEALRAVVVDDDPGTCNFLRAVFSAEGHECSTFLRAELAEQHLAANAADLVMVDVYLGSTNGIDLLKRFRELQPKIYPVIMTANVSVETAARAMSEGAVDYVSKPLTVDQVRGIASRADAFRQQPQPSREIQAPEEPDSSIIGRSPKMLEVYKAIGRVAGSNVSVLITGASGTGKELVARAIHQHSKRKDQPFTPVNCGS